MSDLPRLLSPREAADVLQVHPRTLARLRAAGLLQTCKTPGGYCRYSEAQVRVLRAAREGTLTAAEAAKKMGVDVALLERVVRVYQGSAPLDDGLRVGVELLTSAQAAALAGTDAQTIRNLVRRGALRPAGRQGRRLLFHADDVRAAAGAGGDPLLEAGQVAALAGVDRRTVARWADSGQLSCVVSPGGQRRYRESEVRALMTDGIGRRRRASAGGTVESG